jgi:hypothetical protein
MPGVDCVLVGGTNLGHLRRNVAIIESLFADDAVGEVSGPEATGMPGIAARTRDAWQRVGADWRGLI